MTTLEQTYQQSVASKQLGGSSSVFLGGIKIQKDQNIEKMRFNVNQQMSTILNDFEKNLNIDTINTIQQDCEIRTVSVQDAISELMQMKKDGII